MTACLPVLLVILACTPAPRSVAPLREETRPADSQRVWTAVDRVAESGLPAGLLVADWDDDDEEEESTLDERTVHVHHHIGSAPLFSVRLRLSTRPSASRQGPRSPPACA